MLHPLGGQSASAALEPPREPLPTPKVALPNLTNGLGRAERRPSLAKKFPFPS